MSIHATLSPEAQERLNAQQRNSTISTADRMARLLSEGGMPQCEEAVVKAIERLQATQNPYGSRTNDQPVAMTSLALLAYLGHCETPQSYLIDMIMQG